MGITEILESLTFEKVEMMHQEWIFRAGRFVFPITAAKMGVEIILLFVVAGMAYNAGQNDAVEQVKLSAYIADRGIYSPAEERFIKCAMVVKDTHITWDCYNTNETLQHGYQVNSNITDVLNEYAAANNSLINSTNYTIFK